jgi:hypothetical protein
MEALSAKKISKENIQELSDRERNWLLVIWTFPSKTTHIVQPKSIENWKIRLP